MTNGAGNVVKLVQLHQQTKPSGIVWVQFDHSDVSENKEWKKTFVCTRNWTHMDPSKPCDYTVAVGRNRTAQVVRNSYN